MEKHGDKQTSKPSNGIAADIAQEKAENKSADEVINASFDRSNAKGAAAHGGPPLVQGNVLDIPSAYVTGAADGAAAHIAKDIAHGANHLRHVLTNERGLEELKTGAESFMKWTKAQSERGPVAGLVDPFGVVSGTVELGTQLLQAADKAGFDSAPAVVEAVQNPTPDNIHKVYRSSSEHLGPVAGAATEIAATVAITDGAIQAAGPVVGRLLPAAKKGALGDIAGAGGNAAVGTEGGRVLKPAVQAPANSVLQKPVAPSSNPGWVSDEKPATSIAKPDAQVVDRPLQKPAIDSIKEYPPGTTITDGPNSSKIIDIPGKGKITEFHNGGKLIQLNGETVRELADGTTIRSLPNQMHGYEIKFGKNADPESLINKNLKLLCEQKTERAGLVLDHDLVWRALTSEFAEDILAKIPKNCEWVRAGKEGLVFGDTDGTVVRMSPQSMKSWSDNDRLSDLVPHPISSDRFGNIFVERMPFVECDNSTVADLKAMDKQLRKRGYHLSDKEDERNVGRLKDGTLVVVDAGAIAPLPPRK